MIVFITEESPLFKLLIILDKSPLRVLINQLANDLGDNSLNLPFASGASESCHSIDLEVFFFLKGEEKLLYKPMLTLMV